MYAEGRG